MRRIIAVTTERLEEVSNTASDIIQKVAEVAGTLKVLDTALEETEKTIGSDIVWALRTAIRSIESAIEDAVEITDTIE